jgi:hypothetical protein
MQFKIAKSKPIPTRPSKTGRPAKYPFEKMEVGNSFFIPDLKKRHTIYSCLKTYNINHNKRIQILTRQVEEKNVLGVRVWRIK